MSRRFVILAACVALATSVVNASGSGYDCREEIGKLGSLPFITIPVPFSDDLLPAIVGKNVTRSWSLRGDRRPSPEGMAKQYAPEIREARGAFASKLREVVSGKRFIDLGCGLPDVSAVPRLVAEAMGAKAYVGVDLRNRGHVRRDEFRTGNGFESSFVQQDILAFLEADKSKAGKVFYLSGIEAKDHRKEDAEAYIAAIKDRLRSACRPGDAVIMGAGNSDFGPLPGFVLKATEGEQRIFVREGN
jgi:hypothetical protein